jgi:hypothetical protein
MKKMTLSILAIIHLAAAKATLASLEKRIDAFLAL